MTGWVPSYPIKHIYRVYMAYNTAKTYLSVYDFKGFIYLLAVLL
jgi:hypothetical protein